MEIMRVDFIDGTESWIKDVTSFVSQFKNNFIELNGSPMGGSKKDKNVEFNINLDLVKQIVVWSIIEEVKDAGIEDKPVPDLSDTVIGRG